MRARPILAGFVIAQLVATSARAQAPKAAVFDFELINTSPQPESTEERQRLARLGTTLRELLAASGRYEIVSIEPVRDAVARGPHLRSCNGCAIAFARMLGAETAITGTVQKVSNLILNINVYVEEAGTADGATRAFSVDIRGNNDEAWERGLRYLVRNRLHAP